MAKTSGAKANHGSTEHHFFYTRRLWTGKNENPRWFRNHWFCKAYLPELTHDMIHLLLPDGVPLPNDEILAHARERLTEFTQNNPLFAKKEDRQNLSLACRLTYLIDLFSEAPETAKALRAQLDIIAPNHKKDHHH